MSESVSLEAPDVISTKGWADLILASAIGCRTSSMSVVSYTCGAWNGPKISSLTSFRVWKWGDSSNKDFNVSGGPLIVTASLLVELR